MSNESASEKRPLPVRQVSEFFRSRRITSRSFQRGFHAAMKFDGSVIRGQVIDVSVHGASILVPTEQGPPPSDRLMGASIEELSLDFFGKELYRGPGEVKYCRVTDEGLKLGLRLTSLTVDFSTLHRTSFRLAFGYRWQKVLASLTERAPSGDSFKEWVLAYKHQLQTIKDFLDQEEQATAADDLIVRTQKVQDLIDETYGTVVDRMHQLRRELNQFAERTPAAEREPQRVYFREQLNHLFTLCPFTDRALRKPLGYAGDYELMSMLYRLQPEGESVFAKILNLHSKDEPAGKATINRLQYLSLTISKAIERSLSGRVRIASIGSGAAREVIYLLEQKPELGPRINLTLVDQDERAMENCERTLIPLAIETGAEFQFIGDPISQLIKADNLRACLGERELVYSAGLFDYLDDDTFKGLIGALFRTLVPGGKMIIGNMAAHNPTQHWMEYGMDWYLIHRSREELHALAKKGTPEASSVVVDAEPEGINLFLQICR